MKLKWTQGYSIQIPDLGRVVQPGETVEVSDEPGTVTVYDADGKASEQPTPSLAEQLSQRLGWEEVTKKSAPKANAPDD